MEAFLQLIDPVLRFSFRLHDMATGFLVGHMRGVKVALLSVAHLSLFGLMFPELRKDFGNLAAIVLIGIMFLSPLSRIFRMRLLLQMMGLRRQFGILMGYLATVHAAGYFIDPIWIDRFIMSRISQGFFALDPMIVFGIVAYVLALPLLLTSNAFSLRALGGTRWKRKQRIAYVLFALAILHRFTVKGMTAFALAQAALLIGAYAFAKLLARKNFLPPLERVIVLVAGRYGSWRSGQGMISA